jgi:hypothetical protein
VREAPSPNPRRREPRRRRWLIPVVLALAAHLLLFLKLPTLDFDFSDDLDQVEDDPIIVELIDLDEMSPDADGETAGEHGDDGRQTQDVQADEPPETVSQVADLEPMLRPELDDPAQPPQSFTLQDIMVEDEGQQLLSTATALRQQASQQAQAAPVSRAPEGVCSSDFTTCVYETGDVTEINPALREALVGGPQRENLVAVSDAALQQYREQFHQPAPMHEPETGMPVYSNYGHLDFQVDLGKLTKAAAGTPRNCSIYPDALKFEDEQPKALYVLIDSSGSMVKNKYTSPATRCAWAAAKSALDHGIPVAVINFSDKLYVAEPSMDAQRVAEVICKAQRNETLLPEEQLEEFVAGEGRRDLVLLSDGRIQNFDAALPHLAEVLDRHPTNRGLALLIDPVDGLNGVRTELHLIGFRVTLLRF